MASRNDDYDDEEDLSYGCFGWFIIVVCYILVIITLPFSLLISVKVVNEYERAVILRLGRKQAGGAKGPGLFFILPCIDDLIKVDLRTITFDIKPQEILTKDSVTVTVDGVVYYRVFDPVISVVNIEDARYSTGLLAATTLRNILGTKTLQEILREKDDISKTMQSVLDNATDPWGIKVERVELKDVRLPANMQRAMAAEAEATRDSNAKVISAEGEKKASEALKEAADVINQSPVALQLRYLQTLTTVATEKNSTIIFPIPIEMLNHFSTSPRPQQPQQQTNTLSTSSSRPVYARSRSPQKSHTSYKTVHLSHSDDSNQYTHRY